MTLTGAAMNQIVIAANGHAMPVAMNPKTEEMLAPDKNGMSDRRHCKMTPDTHLWILGDWVDMGDEIDSPGDMLMVFSAFLSPYIFGAWFILCLTKLYRTD
jgi:Family of unknown function (DUF5317)